MGNSYRYAINSLLYNYNYKLKTKNLKLKTKHSLSQRNPPQTSPFNICVANRHFWWSVANAKSHLPLKGGIATALQLIECYSVITKN